MISNIRRDTWSCAVLILFAADRLIKIFVNRGNSFNIGPLLCSILPTTEILGNVSARERAFIIMPPMMLVLWLFSKCGGMKTRIWSMFFLAGMVSVGYDVIMLRGIQYYFSLTLGSNAIIFSLSTIYLLLGILAGIFEMVIETIEC